MTCEKCGGYVEWKGPMINLTHTECADCGGVNCQIPENVEPEECDLTPEELAENTRDHNEAMFWGIHSA